MGHLKRHSHTCKSKDHVKLTFKNSKPQFSPQMREEKKIEVLRGYCRDKGPNHILGLELNEQNTNGRVVRGGISPRT